MSRPLRKHNGVWVHSFFCIDPLEIDPSLLKEHSRKFIRLFFSKLINLTHPVLALHFRISEKMSSVFLPNYYCGKNWIFYRHVFFHEIFLSRIKIRPFFDLLTKYSGVKNQPQLFFLLHITVAPPWGAFTNYVDKTNYFGKWYWKCQRYVDFSL